MLPIDIPTTGGIYRVICKSTGKFYVGSAVNLRKRCSEHFNALRNNKHKNPKLQRAFKKYGEANFFFEVIESVLIPELLTAREQYWFGKLRPQFNICPVAGSALGRKHRKETIEQIRLSNLGWKHTDEAKRKMSDANKARPVNPVAIERMRLANLGRPMSIETRKKLSEAMQGKDNGRTGKKHSPKTKEKISNSLMGHAPYRVQKYILTSPDGEVYEVENLQAFCREHSLVYTSLVKVAKGVYRTSKGWTARYPTEDAS